MEKELLNSDCTMKVLDCLRSSSTDSGSCFHAPWRQESREALIGEGSVFPPLMDCLKSIQVLCQSNFLPSLASCTQISSMHVMYRPDEGAFTYAHIELKRNKAQSL